MKRIVVIEEDKALRRVLKAILVREGFKALRVKRPVDAIRAIGLTTLKDGDCGVIIDVNMVRTNILKLLEEIRMLYPNLQIIALTSFSDCPGLAVDLMTLVDGVLEKPFSLKAITGMMKFVFSPDLRQEALYPRFSVSSN